MSRHDVTDKEWNAIRVLLPKERSGRRGRPWTPHRQVINGILWVLHVGAGWRDVPEEYGKWQTVYNRFRRWSEEGLWDRLWNKLLRRLDQKGKISRALWSIDGSIIRAHRSAAGGSCKKQQNASENALGRSRGGFSTKIHVVCEAKGIPLGITATAGEKGEAPEFENVMNSISLPIHRKSKRPKALAGDKAYSSGAIRNWLRQRAIKDVIPTRTNETRNPRFAKQLYRQRNTVERLIGRIKEFRRIATRYDKNKENYLAMIKIAFFRITAKDI